MSLQLVWFKRDLRLDDHRPLVEAAARGPVLGLYIVEPELLRAPESDRRHWRFVLGALGELREALRARGSELWIRAGSAVEVLSTLRREFAVDRVWSHEETGLEVTFARDRAVKSWADTTGVQWTEIPQFGVVRGLQNRDGWAGRWNRRMGEPCVAPPARFASLPPSLAKVDAGALPTVESLGFSPAPPSADSGEANGRTVLESFLTERGVDYRAAMSSPLTAWNGCSRISPHLAYGTLSLRRVQHRLHEARRAVRDRRDADDPTLDPRWTASLSSFAQRLRWHCHFIQKLESEPEIEFACMNRAYEGLRTREEEWGVGERARFDAWREGRTGFPMVDASMRCLAETGWINFRMRAMLVSFTAYHLWLDWRPVARELARRFVDFEPGIHISQCQMQSGVTGINQLRIYSPAKQVKDNDPEGRFVRRWVPELVGVPTRHIANPERMSSGEQDDAGVHIGQDYPAPIVDHTEAVRAARDRMGAVRRSPQARRLAKEVYLRHGSRKRPRRRPSRRAVAQTDQLALPL